MNKHMKSLSASLSSVTLHFFLFLFTFLGLFTFTQCTPLPRNVSYSDEQALLDFKAAITFDPQNSLANWTRNTSFCKWTGITCSPPPMHSRVVRLNLSSMNLEGTISPALGNLSALQSLNLSFNVFRGQIPPQLGQLSYAKELRLSNNQLEGNIPPSLGRCTSLVNLILSFNQLQGSIPPELGFLPRLEMLYLGDNQLQGRIPYSIGNLSSLIDFRLSGTFVNGTIPDELGMLNKLKSLYLYDNDLSGTIPSSIGNLSSLIELSLSKNILQDSILDVFDKLAMLTKLQFLRLGINDLTGIIPSFIGNFSSLIELNLAMNSLTGTIPSSIGNLPSLQQLFLRNNNIEGSIPQEISNLTKLIILDLRNNVLSGYIPFGIGRFHKMHRLYLSSNKLKGRIPEEIGQMQSLGLLDVSYNKLSGKIPPSIGRLEQLRRIFLNNNQLSGEIPSSLASIPNVELLDLSHNNLTGSIPGEVMASLKNLQFYLNLSCNFLQGYLPEDIRKIESVKAIDVSDNILDGEIPYVLANCIALLYLNLSHNIFQGRIPDALSKLQNLEDIDLSSNCLSGSIPPSFKQMRMLRYMNVSFNNLTGYVGEEVILNNTIVVLSMGNPGLCRPKKYFLSACAKEGQGKKSALRNKVVAAVGVTAFILLFSIFALLWRRKISRQQPDIPNLMFEKIRYPKFSYHDIVIATNGFNEENLLGAGKSGSVFKGTLEDGRLVAIKFLHMQNKEGERNFKTECKVLGRIRHRNVIRVISAFSYLNIKALVLQFACNGSLEKHLYPEGDEEDSCRLGLSECLNIAIDVAHGMEYLHHDCVTQVVHCDLKPSNVLLDADMTALVSDFGISRLTNFADFMESLGTSCAARGTIGYIAPEYGLGENISIKGDVYSYGILLLEMVTRKKPTDTIFVGDLNLRSWVRSAFPNSLVNVVDNPMLRNLTMEQHRCLISFIHVGLLCSHESPQYRPVMRNVSRALESLRATFMGSATASSYLRTPILDLVSVPSTSHARDGAISDSQSSTY